MKKEIYSDEYLQLPECQLLIAIINQAVVDNDVEFLNKDNEYLKMYLDTLKINPDKFFDRLKRSRRDA